MTVTEDKDTQVVIDGPALVAPPATPPAVEPAERRYVAITLTDDLRTAIDDAVKAHGDTTPGLLCRELIAKALGVTIDIDRAKPTKYATEAEKKAAMKVRQLERKAEIAEGLALLKAKKAAEKAAAEDALKDAQS